MEFVTIIIISGKLPSLMAKFILVIIIRVSMSEPNIDESLSTFISVVCCSVNHLQLLFWV